MDLIDEVSDRGGELEIDLVGRGERGQRWTRACLSPFGHRCDTSGVVERGHHRRAAL